MRIRVAHRFSWLAALAATCVSVATAVGRQAPAATGGATPPATSTPAAALAVSPGSTPPRIASYSIDVELDPDRHTLTGREVITWRNLTPRATSELRLHLYWNAWRNTDSSWLREWRLAGPLPGLESRRPEDWAKVDVSAVRLLGLGGAPPIDLTSVIRFIAPDDGNARDRTMAAIALPAAVGPGDTINLAVEWISQVPQTFARTGRIGDYYFIAHWFPKVAVLAADGWTSHQFHGGTEFFSDYGTYDVRIVVPAGWTVGATGRAQDVTVRDGKAVHRYRQDDVHDFAWVTSPDLIEREARFSHGSLPEVRMRLLLQPEHVSQAERHFAATRAALRYYGEWFGPYPYGHVTIVDPAWQSGSGGMEYPTLFTAGTRWLAPRGVAEPEGVTIHEAGHQFWYGLVASNEFEHAWLDEGLNTFSAERVLAEAFSPTFHSERFFNGFLPWTYRDVPLTRSASEGWARYRAAARSDVPNTPSWRYSPATGRAISYGKTALWLHTLERLVGWPTLRQILHTFFERWRYRHPKPEDFFAVASELSGRDLTWFFDQVHRSSGVFDYGVASLTSEQPTFTGHGDGVAAGFERDAARGDGYETELVVRRYGDALFPVDVLVNFADGTRRRERWDGRDLWRSFRFTSASRAVSAVVDPDGVLELDVVRTNNSYTLEPRGPHAATKWSLAWQVWLQDRLLTFSAAF